MKQTHTPEPDVDSINTEVEDILSELPSEVETAFDLPSKGLLYANKTEAVTVRPLSFEDEKFLLSAKNDPSYDPVNSILHRCVKGVDINDLLMMDKMFIIMKIRELSYGKSYSFSVTCPQCNFVNPLTLDIASLKVTGLSEEVVDPVEVDLPMIKKKAKIRFPRVRDEKYLNADTGVLDNLWRFVVEIGGSTQSTVISKVIPKLPSADVHTLIQGMTMGDYGIDTEVDYGCHNCKTKNRIALPITENFFSVS